MDAVRANPETGRVDGLLGVYSDNQFAQLPRVPCPVCGTAVTYGRIRADASLTDPFGLSWTVGAWSCPADPDHAPNHR